MYNLPVGISANITTAQVAVQTPPSKRKPSQLQTKTKMKKYEFGLDMEEEDKNIRHRNHPHYQKGIVSLLATLSPISNYICSSP